MKAVIFNGAKDDSPAIAAIENSLVSLLSASGWEVEPIKLKEKQIAGCLGCFGCWIRTPGICVIDDYGRETTRKAQQSDLLVWLTPITFGGYSSELKKALDRIIPLLLPYFQVYHGQVHHQMRYEKSPKLLVIGTEPLNREYEETFSVLSERNALNFRPPKHATGVFKSQSSDEAASFVRDLLMKMEVLP